MRIQQAGFIGELEPTTGYYNIFNPDGQVVDEGHHDDPKQAFEEMDRRIGIHVRKSRQPQLVT